VIGPSPRPDAPPLLVHALDIGERVFAVGMTIALLARFWGSHLFVGDGVILASEVLVAVIMATRRRTLAITLRPVDWIIALVGICAPMLVVPGGDPVVIPAVTSIMMLIGFFFSMWGQLTLRRSFGLVAANRGVVRGGPYAIVRHPIYAGYLLTYVGFVLAHPLAWNLGVELFTGMLIVVRVLAEERVLLEDPLYARLAGDVRFRLVPGLF
jgi:protein-S-isoprenylcysteine O-methyltransferase Ste14